MISTLQYLTQQKEDDLMVTIVSHWSDLMTDTFMQTKLWTSVIKGAGATDPQKAASILKQMTERGIHPNVVSYNTLMNAWVAANQPMKCAETMQEMRGAGVVPNVTSYTTLMNAWVAANQPVKCAETMQEMRGAGVVPNVTSYNTLMNAWVAANQPVKCGA
jgi:pentatricopeptide repeat domain-containing protein 1